MSQINETKNPAAPEGAEGEESVAAVRAGRIITTVVVLLSAAAVFFLVRHYAPKAEKKESKIFAPEAPKAPVKTDASTPKDMRLTDVSAESGIEFTHVTGARGKRLLPETMGAGAAFLDYDADGDPDLFLVNSCAWPDDPSPETATQALFRNDGGRFTNVTREAGLEATFYGQGVAAADYDGDGFVDLFVTAVGGNRLFKNNGGKSFEDATKSAGVGGNGGWSTGAAFLDYDGDGRLDLFVANYVQWSPELDLAQSFKLTGIGRAYGPPVSFKGDYPQLLRQKTDGSFEDVSEKAGVQVRNPATKVPAGKSLGVAICDIDGDRRPDILVANDTVQNFALRNKGDGTFEEIARNVCIAFDEKGNARGAMGIDTADFRNDGSFAVAIGNFANEMDALFVNEAKGEPIFVDLAAACGLGAPTRQSLTFGVLFADLDLDGRVDYVTANGHVEPEIARVQESQSHAQPMEIFWNAGGAAEREFVQLKSGDIGPDAFRPIVGRGLLTADIDGDGDLDILITANGGKPRLLRNDTPGRRSLRLDVRTKDGKRTAIGAVIECETLAGLQRRFVGGAGSYLSQSEQIVTIGLGEAKEATRVVVRWPDGTTKTIERPAAGRLVVTP